jgi:hypothetical protein
MSVSTLSYIVSIIEKYKEGEKYLILPEVVSYEGKIYYGARQFDFIWRKVSYQSVADQMGVFSSTQTQAMG